jgi:gamma-glutamyl:cysteine ligase YbdK (ATP-grasp superfamily)
MGRHAAELEHRFGSSPPLTIGVEEGLLLVDDEHRLVAGAERVIDGLDPAARESVSTEIFAPQIELKTGICGEPALAEIERILADGNGAERQRRAFERGGSLAVLDHLAAATAAD